MEYKFKIAICDEKASFSCIIMKSISKYMEDNNIIYKADVFDSQEQLIDRLNKGILYTVVFLGLEDAVTVAADIKRLYPGMIVVLLGNDLNESIEGYKIGAFRYINKDGDVGREIYEVADSVKEKIFKEDEYWFDGKKIFIDEIIYIESRLHWVEFHLNENGMNLYQVHEKLDDIEKRLPDSKFLRIHKSYLVNIECIEEVKNYSILLNTGERLPVPKLRYRYVKDSFDTYILNK